MANDQMVLRVETTRNGRGLATSWASAIREVTKLRGDVKWCRPAPAQRWQGD